MGESRRKRERFLAAHPKCCFCGGLRAARTVDHLPSRDCFKGRAFPEEFEFPACRECQAVTRQDEQVFSFVTQFVDANPANYDGPKSRRALQGIRNNFPHLLPQLIDDPIRRAQALAQLGQPIPILRDRTDGSPVAFPVGIGPHIESVARKLLLAVYYKERGRIVPSHHRSWLSWNIAADLRAMDKVIEVTRMGRFRTNGLRRKVEFGDQFAYKWDHSEPPEPSDLFMMVAQFGGGMVITGMLADEDAYLSMIESGDDPSEWRLAAFVTE